MKYLVLSAVASAIASFDQVTKLLIHTRFQLSESMPIIDGFFSFTYVRNPGGAFGMFRNSGETFRMIVFIVLPILALFLIFHMVSKVKKDHWPAILALSFILGGAIGNIIDRIYFGFVVDFIDFHLPSGLAFPTFNLADSAVVLGVCVLTFIMYKDPKSLPL